jgi:hypothetical protein
MWWALSALRGLLGVHVGWLVKVGFRVMGLAELAILVPM